MPDRRNGIAKIWSIYYRLEIFSRKNNVSTHGDQVQDRPLSDREMFFVRRRMSLASSSIYVYLYGIG